MDVVFPVMPFADAGRPSMGVSLLSAEVKAAGYSAETICFYLDLAGEMGLEAYQRVASGFPPNLLLGEWIFADDLFGDEIPDTGAYLADIFMPMAGPDEALISAMLKVRRERAAFLDDCVARIMAHRPKVVGFTTVFHQTFACLAVARRLKALADPPVIVFGGANCEGDMGLQLIQSFREIDFICSGEADISFPMLLERIFGGAEEGPIPGVLEQGKAELPVKSTAVMDLDALPYPDFDGYFDGLAASKLAGQFEGHLVFETSRGCWWGAKHHCTFCGLNGDTLAFRSKSPDRAFAEIEHLMNRYGARKAGCVDNILDMKYVTTLFPRLSEAGFELEIFYEVKANLRYEQLRKLRAGGLNHIQPGIESFSDAVLKLMDKGCTGFQNIQLMRWSRELGIEVSWNVLSGFPGEDPAEYTAMAELMPKLTHLDPPCSCGMVRLDRFSPFHARSDAFGFKRMRPARAYFYVTPFDRRELSRLAYYFDFDYEDDRDPNTYIAPVQRAVQAWQAARSRPEGQPCLDAEFKGDRVTIVDTRDIATAGRHVLDGLAAEIYARCDSAKTSASLASALDRPEAEIEAILADLERHKLIVRQGDRVLSLAVFRTRPEIPDHKPAREKHAVDAEAVPA